MKTRSILLGIASLAAGLSSALAQTAVTDPVGYITHTIAGNAANNPFGADTLVAATLVNKVEFAGVISAVPSGTTVSFAAALPASVVAGMCIEVKDGSQEGAWNTIVAVSGDRLSLTTQTALPAGVASGAKVSIRRHTTLADLFGANNSAGLDFADEVQVLDASTGSAAPYNFATVADGAPTPGWYDANGNPSNDVMITPGNSVLVRRKATTAKSLVSVGHVKLGKTQIGIFATGDNWVAPMRATGVTLADSNLDTGVLATGLDRGDGSGAEDLVIFLNDDQSASSYFAADPLAGANGFVDPNGSPAGTVLISESEGIIIRRQASSGNGIWTVPGVTVN